MLTSLHLCLERERDRDRDRDRKKERKREREGELSYFGNTMNIHHAWYAINGINLFTFLGSYIDFSKNSLF